MYLLATGLDKLRGWWSIEGSWPDDSDEAGAVVLGTGGAVAGKGLLKLLGGALGAIAVASHHEVVLGIVGGLFVLEAVSVIVQVFWFKRTGRRVFRMAPIHHHFEQLGWKESKVVVRFWIIAIVLALIGLSTLKLR